LVSVVAVPTQTEPGIVRDVPTQTDFPRAVAMGAATDLATQTDAPVQAASVDDTRTLSLTTTISHAMRQVLLEERTEALRASRQERVELLRARLAAWGVDRDRDCLKSTLCSAFEAGSPLAGYTTADAVAHEMAHLKFLHEYTDYARRAQTLPPAERQLLKRSYPVPAVYPWFYRPRASTRE
jgi:hypothetical protein